MVKKIRELTDTERVALLKKGYNLWEIMAYEVGIPDAVSSQSYDKKRCDGDSDDKEEE